MTLGRPPRICHVVLSLRPGGLENGVVNVVNGLDPEEFTSSVCCLREIGGFAERITAPRATVFSMGSRGGTDLGLPFRLARQLHAMEIDIVHTRNLEAFLYGAVAAKICGTPRLIHSEHGRTFPERPHRAWLQRRLLKWTDYAFAVSERLKTDLVREIGLDPGLLDVNWNGVDLKRFAPMGRPANRASDAVVIGSVGRLVSVKNYALLLQAVSQLREGPAVRVVLVGHGPESRSLQMLAATLDIENRVQFVGHSDDVPALLRAMDIFVLPSVSEGMSNTLLEAMASGVAVVASDVGGNGELIEDGTSGLLFPSGDVRALTHRLSQLVYDAALRTRLSAAALTRARQEFSMDAMIARYGAMYRRVLAGAAR
jgi:sugar transferase (PEP-CTERM/EpsH1 system associated)